MADNEKIYYFFTCWLKIVDFYVLASALSFWLAFLHIFFKWDLKSSLFSITVPRMFSSVTLLVVVLLKEKSENGCVKSVQIRSYFWTVFSCTWPEYRNTGIQSEYRKIRTRNNSVFGHFSRIKKSCLSLLITILVFLSEEYIALPAA